MEIDLLSSTKIVEMKRRWTKSFDEWNGNVIELSSTLFFSNFISSSSLIVHRKFYASRVEVCEGREKAKEREEIAQSETTWEVIIRVWDATKLRLDSEDSQSGNGQWKEVYIEWVMEQLILNGPISVRRRME